MFGVLFTVALVGSLRDVAGAGRAQRSDLSQTPGFHLIGHGMVETRFGTSASLLPSGQVLVLGTDKTAELYDPATQSFSVAADTLSDFPGT